MVLALQPPAELQSWLVFVGIFLGTLTAVLTAAGWILRRAVLPALRHVITEETQSLKGDITSVKQTVDFHLGVNGREAEGDDQDREQPARVLMLRTSSRARRVDHEVDGVQDELARHKQESELEHRKLRSLIEDMEGTG